MYEDIFELVTIAARKRNLKESTANAYCHALSPFLNATGKPWQELSVADADDYLTAKRLAGIPLLPCSIHCTTRADPFNLQQPATSL